LKPGFGLTETSPTSHFNPLEYYESKAGTVGILFPNLECRIVKEDGDDAQDGEPGEVWIRGPSIMKVLLSIFSNNLSHDLFSKGYINNAKATLECITSDGWFQTGDIGVRSADGWYSIVDRKKELIKYKGFQGELLADSPTKLSLSTVPPAELEALLLTHSDIIDCGVIGVYDETQVTELPR
jgi:4-coumarate--CoA ligase